MLKCKFNGKLFTQVPAAITSPVAANIICGQKRDVCVLLYESYSQCESAFYKLESFLKSQNQDGDVSYVLRLFPSANSSLNPFESYCARAAVLGALSSPIKGEKLVILTSIDALFEKFAMPDDNSHIVIEKGQKISMSDLADTLGNKYGYYNEVLCESPGQYALRGSVLDVYPVSALSPYRLDFFGNVIDGIKSFDSATQITKGAVDSIRIDSASYETERAQTLANLLKKDSLIGFVDISYMYRRCPEVFLYNDNGSANNGFSKSDLSKFDFFAITSLDTASELFDEAKAVKISGEPVSIYLNVNFGNLIGAERVRSESQARADFLQKLAQLQKNGYDIFVEAANDSEKKLVKTQIKSLSLKLNPIFTEPFFGEGFILDFEKSHFKLNAKSNKGAVFVSQSEFFGRKNKVFAGANKQTKPVKTQIDTALDFSELAEGDILVHVGHGVCKYRGLCSVNSPAGVQETIKLEFDENAFLYVPLHNAYLLTRYLNLDKKSPKLSKLDAKSWLKVRSSAEKASLDYAAELLNVQAKRESTKGIAFPEDDDWQKSFDDSFPFAETPDQLHAIEDVKKDMQSENPMERLICADVGFGKTEVAMRAVFKAASSGRQAAILCPTTILCQQHFMNFKDRFAPYPIVVESLSRFKTKAQSDTIKAQLASGAIDVIIGTHALLSDDVNFANLGLLVIDEEHRFGVKNKEKIKKLASNIDILTMSATPIPRTLYFAMMGAKQMSVMETPPRDRLPVETFVREYSPLAVKEAISREILRGGQVFYLHNEVKTIEQKAQQIREMFPSLRVAVGHGQMGEHKLEKLMCEFIDGKYDVLVCTTIIESGIDIPNCNTIIIDSADRFGLAQLYQLRGRVGRFNRQAYAYLFLRDKDIIVQKAKERLSAIRQYNKPGAGFRIAARDLQLRGCGNILGARQSGHIAGVGFDLYCSLLRQSVARLKGEKVAFAIRAKIDLDFIKLGDYEAALAISRAKTHTSETQLFAEKKEPLKLAMALISKDYVPQAQIRIDMYRKIALLETESDLKELKKTFKDRFGKIPPETERLFILAKIRILAEQNSFSCVASEGDLLKLREAFTAKDVFFRVAGAIPRLTKQNPDEKLLEIENYLRYTVKSVRK